ncbi:MAG: beta-lactamase family protein [Planctomycetes bacterium]|nr:beta-lactamase family protein [Planctomycetota bacterium]
MKKLILITSCMLALLMPTRLFALELSEEQTQKLNTYLERQADAFHLPGLACALFTTDQTVTVKLFERGVSESSSFLIGSCSKTFTALAALLSLEAENIPLDTPLSELLPTLTFQGQRKPVTVRNLLEHRSGLTRRQGFTELPSLQALEETGLVLKPANEPGENYNYCNLNYTILGLIIEKITHQTYAEYVHNCIFMPLGMTDSHAGPPPEDAELAPEHQYLFGYPLEVSHSLPSPTTIPAGFIRTSVRDLALFQRCLMTGGLLDEKRIFSRHLIDLMTTPSGQAEYGYGMGLTRGYLPPAGALSGHEGATQTSYSLTAWFPEKQYGLVLLVNINLFDPFTDPGSAIFQNLVRILESQPIKPIRPYKIYLRYVLLILIVFNLSSLIRNLLKLHRLGWPLHLPDNKRKWFSALTGFALPIIIWFALLRWTQISLPHLIKLEPDFIWTVIVLTVFGMIKSSLKNCTNSTTQ